MTKWIIALAAILAVSFAHATNHAFAPGAPQSVSATAGNASATVSFSPPASDGNDPITSYTVTSSPGGITASAAASPITVTGLTNGTAYTFTVRATNSIGTGPASAASNSVTPATVPGAPTIGTATAGNAQASVSFTPPASNGGSPIIEYRVTSSPGGIVVTGTSSPVVVTGLTNGTAYTFTVRARNAVGMSDPSAASNSVTPATVPGAPTIGTATGGNGQASVSFTAPASNGGSAIIDYTVTSSPGGITATGTASPIAVAGLTNGTAYTFTVTARNALGSGAASASSNSVTPATVPGAPTIGTATGGNAQASVSFTAPASNGGSAIIDYTVTSSPGGITATGAASPITVTGLANGTAYTFTVTARNAVGSGPASAASNSVTPSVGLPGAPTNVTATAGNASATVTFSAPASSGASPITSYTVTSSPGNITATGSASPITVTGLANGTAYTFTVAAANAQGAGPASTPSNSVTPATVPGAPTIGTATGGNGQASVSFTAPASNGGSAIIDYTVTSSPGGITASGTASPITVTGLTNGTAYTFTVTARNAIGSGAASAASNSVTPATVPGAPTIGTATGGNAQASVSFTAPASNGGSAIVDYTVTSSPGGITATGTGSPITVTGLTNGTAYTFTVTARNAAGSGPASAASNSVTIGSVPGAPTIGTATAANAQATVTFTAPASDGGLAIVDYTVTSSPGGITATGAASPIGVSGLTNGTAYTFTVTARNAIGTGPASAASNSVTPSTVPGAPTIGTASAGNAQATVTFTAPASDGGAAITGYTVTSSPGGITATGASSPITVTGLTNGTAYTFTVTATNARGTGPASAASNSVTPTDAPTPPTLAPSSHDFGGQSMRTTQRAAFTLTNVATVAIMVSGISVTGTGYAVTHDCGSSLAAGGTCTATVAFTPAAEGTSAGTLTIVTNAGTRTATLAGIGEKSLVSHYYRSILRRAPDSGGKQFWEAEAARVAQLGANVNETWFAMAMSFYNSIEYLAFGRNPTEYVRDLYNTFFNRNADDAGLNYWTGQMSAGMPREIVLVSFMFSTEFTQFAQAIFGNTQVRSEVDTVVDFYRGLLSRLPDSAGFNFWVGEFRQAQCQGGNAIYEKVEAISSAYANSAEYGARGRSNAQYIGDLYNAFLRRGGDLDGVRFWIGQLDTGARSREQVRRDFVASAEFNARVVAMVNQGCLR